VSIDLRWLARVLIAITAIRSNTDVVPRRVPFLAILSAVGSDRLWLNALHVGVVAGGFLVFTPLWRSGSVLVGTVWIVAVLGNMALFSNGRLFQGLLLLFCGLVTTEFGLSLLRAQVIVLYAGAALAKATDPDWWNGRFLASLWEFHGGSRPVASLMWVAQGVSVLTIVTETGIACALARPSLRNVGVVVAVVFHSLTVVILNEDFATFSYAVVLVTAVLFASPPTVRAAQCRFPKLLKMSTFDELRRSPATIGPLNVVVGHRTLGRLLSVCFLTLLTAPGQLLALGFVATTSRLGLFAARSVGFVGLTVLLVIVGATSFLPPRQRAMTSAPRRRPSS
jgi:hypothetical protein